MIERVNAGPAPRVCGRRGRAQLCFSAQVAPLQNPAFKDLYVLLQWLALYSGRSPAWALKFRGVFKIHLHGSCSWDTYVNRYDSVGHIESID
jgi:hypothetical protein